jgi:arabinan endo-1,5-alpha-L-arabinosidase
VYFRFNTGSEIGIWKSSSLTGPWVYQGKVLPNGSSINLAGNTDCWVSRITGSEYINRLDMADTETT